jgi:hypothetical protein
LLGVSASVTQLQARPLTPAEARHFPYQANLPACNDPAVVAKIQSRFEDAEDEYWHSGLRIQAFDRIDEIGYRTNGEDYIPRRYCVAEALMNDQKLRPVSYSINQDLGIIGFLGTIGVEWCVGGLDREKAYAPDCKMARP